MISYSVANEKSPGKCIHPHGGCLAECSRQNLVDLKDGTIVILTGAGDEVGGGECLDKASGSLTLRICVPPHLLPIMIAQGSLSGPFRPQDQHVCFPLCSLHICYSTRQLNIPVTCMFDRLVIL